VVNQERLPQQKERFGLSELGTALLCFLHLFMIYPPIRFLRGEVLVLEIGPAWNAGGLFIKTHLALAKLNNDFLERSATEGCQCRRGM